MQPSQTKEVRMLQDAPAWEQLEVKKDGLLATQAADARLRQVAGGMQRSEKSCSGRIAPPWPNWRPSGQTSYCQPRACLQQIAKLEVRMR